MVVAVEELVRLLSSRAEERAVLLAALHQAEPQDGVLRVLEAECGKRWELVRDDVRLHITGIDKDADALRIDATSAATSTRRSWETCDR